MNTLMEVTVAIFILAVIMSPMFQLASSNLNRAAFSTRRSQGHNLARSIVQRFEGDGLTALYGLGRREDDNLIVIDEPHIHDNLIAAVVPTELQGEKGDLETIVQLEEQEPGLAVLRATVFVGQGEGRYASESVRVVRTWW